MFIFDNNLKLLVAAGVFYGLHPQLPIIDVIRKEAKTKPCPRISFYSFALKLLLQTTYCTCSELNISTVLHTSNQVETVNICNSVTPLAALGNALSIRESGTAIYYSMQYALFSEPQDPINQSRTRIRIALKHSPCGSRSIIQQVGPRA